MLRTRNAASVFGVLNSTITSISGNRPVLFGIIKANKYLSS